MFSEENIMHTIVGIGLIGAFIGTVVGCLWLSYREEIEMKKRRKQAKRGNTNYARFKAQLVTSSKVIQKG